MRILLKKPICFFYRLEKFSLNAYEIRIQSDIKLDKKVYSSSSIDQVATIWIEKNNPNTTWMWYYSSYTFKLQTYY